MISIIKNQKIVYTVKVLSPCQFLQKKAKNKVFKPFVGKILKYPLDLALCTTLPITINIVNTICLKITQRWRKVHCNNRSYKISKLHSNSTSILFMQEQILKRNI
ncbi:hypothetical protein RIR_jg17097.t1 [Rhizophagus irregularis DAOM 181602=DAOM 197198]|nr:hypothetical protein RIR_jg17097.t1 [Rhizophagus irregularis DAOM 181602=DAOM 197198]